MQSIGPVFTTQVPAPQESADINKAFNYYHYGQAEAPTTESQVDTNPPVSMAGWLKYLKDRVTTLENGVSNVQSLTPIQNLNDITATKFYASTTSPTTSLNYPTTTPGFLNVVSKDGKIYQSYQTIVNTDSTSYPDPDSFFWRSGSTSVGITTWSDWAKASKDGHTHNTLYYTKSEVNTKILWEAFQPNRVMITNGDGKITYSDITSVELNALNDIGAVSLPNQLLNKADKTHYHDDRYYLRSSVTDPQTGAQKTQRVFVQDPALGNPSGAAVGDLWFW